MSKNLPVPVSGVQKHKADRETAENKCKQQQYNENIINNTGKNDSNKYQPASTSKQLLQLLQLVNHVMQELHDADTLQEKLTNMFDHNYQY